MHLKVQTPTNTVLESEVSAVDFEAVDGHFTLLPRHADFISIVNFGIIAVKLANGKDTYIASNTGVLSKQGKNVNISVRNAIVNEDINVLTGIIESEFKKFNEERKETNTAMARLEIGITRGFMKLNKGEINA